MNDKAPSFGRVPTAPIFAGVLKRIAKKPAALMLYVVYLAHANGKSWESYVGEGRIIAQTGMDSSTVTRARRELEAARLIVDTGRNKKGCKVYRIEHCPPQPCGESKDHAPAPVRGAPRSAPRTRARKPPAPVRDIQSTEQSTPKRAARARTEGKAGDGLWEAICNAFELKPVTDADRKRVGRIVHDLGLKGATPADVPVRLDRYRRQWPNAAATPEALLKHWDAFAKSNGHAQAGDASVLSLDDLHGDAPDADDPSLDSTFNGA